MFLISDQAARSLFNLKGESTNETEREDLELPLFDFKIIANATGNFSPKNKLGEGGFGPVYKEVISLKFIHAKS